LPGIPFINPFYPYAALLFYPIVRLLKENPENKKVTGRMFAFCKEKEKNNSMTEIQKVYKVYLLINNSFKLLQL
jgi:hypothetical protein